MKKDERADIDVQSQNGMCLVDEQGLIMFDHSIALEAVDGDNDILAEVVEIFLKQDYPRHLQNLVAAVEARDGELMRKAAHGLKGALVSFGASAAAATALQLQEMGTLGEMDLAREKLGEWE